MFVSLPSVEQFTVTVVATAIRTMIEAAPTILGGVAIAAWLRTLATPEKVQNVFRGHGVQGILRTVMVGMTMPVCSIGILPVLRELRRLGLATNKLLVLAIVTPLLNPISLLYAFTVLPASQLFSLFFSSLLLALVIGDFTGRLTLPSSITAAARPAGLTGATRVRNLLVAATRILTGRPLLDLALATLLCSLVTSLIPSGTFGEVCGVSHAGGPVVVSCLALFQYVGPSHGIIQLIAIGKAGLSVPTGLALYVFGVGLSAANVWLLVKWCGRRRTFALAVAVFFCVCTTAYAASAILPASTAEVEETTGLDNLARSSFAAYRHFSKVITDGLQFSDAMMTVGASALVLLTVAGSIVRLTKVDFKDDDPDAQSKLDNSRMGKAMPASQLGAVAVCGMAVVCFLVTYVFFPQPKECVEDMHSIRMDACIALRGGKVKEALQQIAVWDSLAAKLPVSAAVHFSFPTAGQRQATRNLRLALHATRTFLREGDLVAARQQIPDLNRLQAETRSTYIGNDL